MTFHLPTLLAPRIPLNSTAINTELNFYTFDRQSKFRLKILYSKFKNDLKSFSDIFLRLYLQALPDIQGNNIDYSKNYCLIH